MSRVCVGPEPRGHRCIGGSADRRPRGGAVQLETEASYPFPWTVVEFFGVFPEVVLMRSPPARGIELPAGPIDLVIASGSIWYLRPCMPWQSFLAGPQAAWLDGKRVLTLTTCRNMWVTGWNLWVDLLRGHGAEVVDRITVTHAGHAFASFYSTVFWMVTGKRESKVLPKVEIDAETLERVRTYGCLLGERLPGDGSLLGDVNTATVTHAHAFGELVVGARLFPVQARIYAALSSPGSFLRGVFALNPFVFDHPGHHARDPVPVVSPPLPCPHQPLGGAPSLALTVEGLAHLR